MNNSFPWNKMSDELWKQHLNLWKQVIYPKYNKFFHYISHNTQIYNNKCQCLDEDISDMFLSFLDNNIKNSENICSRFQDAGIYNKTCISALVECQKFQLINDSIKVHYVKFPWLPIYNEDLPYSGDFYFEPVKNWYQLSQPVRCDKNTFKDVRNNCWGKDKLHKNHWDVQHPTQGTNSYKNVTFDGRIL